MAMSNVNRDVFNGVVHMPASFPLRDDAPVISLGERVVYLGTDEPEHGTIRWMGKLPEISEGLAVGVELDNAVGAIDGFWGGKKLFSCESMHGIVIDVKGLIKEVDFFGDCADAASERTTNPPKQSHMAEPHEDLSMTKVARNEVGGLTGDDILQQMTKTNGTTDSTSTAAKDIISIQESTSKNNGDVEIEKFLSSKSITNGNRSFDRRVYARMFAECEVERWYEALEFDSDGLPDLKFDDDIKVDRKKKSSTLGTDVTVSSKPKKERGGVFRFIRWLRRSKSSKSSGGSLKMSGSDSSRGRTSSLDSMTSLSDSFHYISVGVSCPEGIHGSCSTDPNDQFYEDLEVSLPSSPATSVHPSIKKFNSLSRSVPHKREQKQIESNNSHFSRELVSPGSSSMRRKKRKAPLPPSLSSIGSIADKDNDRRCSRSRLRNVSLSSTKISGSVVGFPVGMQVKVSNLQTSSREMASSTSAIYKHIARDAKCVLKTQSNCSLVRGQQVMADASEKFEGAISPPEEQSMSRVNSKVHVKNKRKAPPPPTAVTASKLAVIEMDDSTTVNDITIQHSLQNGAYFLDADDVAKPDCKENTEVIDVAESQSVELPTSMDKLVKNVSMDGIEKNASSQERTDKFRNSDEKVDKKSSGSIESNSETPFLVDGCSSIMTSSCGDNGLVKNVAGQCNSDVDMVSMSFDRDIENPDEVPVDVSTEPHRNMIEPLSRSPPECTKFEKQLVKGARSNESNVDIESLQELVESLVKQYCNNVKANELSKIKNDYDSNGAAININYLNGISVTEMKPTVTSEMLPKMDVSMRMVSSVGCNSLPETSNGCLLEKTPKTFVNKVSSKIYTADSNEVSDERSRKELNVNRDEGNIYDFPKRLIDRCQMSEKIRPKVDCDVGANKGFESGQDSSTDDGSYGIYEPIGHFWCSRTERHRHSTSNSSCDESVCTSLPVSMNSNLKEKASSMEHNPTYGRIESCTKEFTKCENRKREKVIRRLSVNGQRQSLLKEDGNRKETSFDVDDYGSESSRANSLRNDSLQGVHSSHQPPLYENVHMHDTKHGLTRNKNQIHCQNASFPMMPPYWNPSLLPYSPYSVQPYSQLQAFTAVPVVPSGISPVCVQHTNYVQPHYSCICPMSMPLSNIVDGDPYTNSVMTYDPCCTSRQAGVRKKSISVKLSTNPFLQEDARKQHKSQNKSKSIPDNNNMTVASETCVEGKPTCVSPFSVKSVVTDKCHTESNTKVAHDTNVPPCPPPRVGSVGRSSRLAAKCSFLKENGKYVTDKIENDGRHLICDSENGAANPNRMKSGDEHRKGGDIQRQALPIWDCSIVIGGVTITTPLNLWPLEYKLVTPELECIKASLEGKSIHEELRKSGDVTTIKLREQLEISIRNGDCAEAQLFAKRLAQSKIESSVTQNSSLNGTVDEPNKIILDMYVEDSVSHHGPIPIQVNSSMTVGELKKKVFREFQFPTSVQRWILGRQLASCDNDKLDRFGVDFNGCSVYLYIANPGNVDVKAGDLLWDNDKREMEKMHEKTVSARLKRESELTTMQLEALKREKLEKKPDDFLNNLPQPNAKLNTFQAGWHCLICTLVNVPTRPGCEACGTARPNDYKVPGAYQMQESERLRLKEEKEVDKALELTLREAEEKQKHENLQNYVQLMKLEEQDVVTNEHAFECSICFGDIEPLEGVKLRDCLHIFCRGCLSDTVAYSEEATVKCPYRDDNYSCTSVLQEREIRSLVSADVFERHLQKSIVTAESQAQNSFHCKTPDCKGWCLYDDNVNEFYCPVCRHNNCLTCRVIHEGMNCRQYQDRLSATCSADEEAHKTKQAIEEMVKSGEALHCPNCNIIIMKKWGCDWICCSVCKLEICWVTKQRRWGPAGHGDTSGGCRCGLRGVRCHPNCNYCH